MRPPFLGFSGFLLIFAACSGCGDDGPIGPPDKGSPLIGVIFPTSPTSFDRDADGLVDLEVGFVDPGSGIDASTIRLTSDRQVKGPSGSGANLLEFWTVVRADSAGLVVEETVDNLLSRGEVGLTVAVADRAGNAMERTITVDLPPAARHKVIDLDADYKDNAGQVTIGPDGKKAYVTSAEIGSSALSIVDLERLELLKVVRVPISGLFETVIDNERGLLYLVSHDESLVGVFDLASETFQAPIETRIPGIDAALSEQRDRLYVGLLNSEASISVIDLTSRREVQIFHLGVFNDVNPNGSLGMHELLLDPAESRVYATTSGGQTGLLVFDPDTGELLEQVDLEPENPSRLGRARDLDPLNGQLIATSSDMAGFGLFRILSGSPPTQVVRVKVIERFLGLRDVAVAPDGRELVVTTVGFGAELHGTLLVDAGTLEVIWEDRFSAEIVGPQGVVFRPDGNAILVTGGLSGRQPGPGPSELTIYLYR